MRGLERKQRCQDLLEGVPERKACLGKSGAISWTSVSLFQITSLRAIGSFRQDPESFLG